MTSLLVVVVSLGVAACGGASVATVTVTRTSSVAAPSTTAATTPAAPTSSSTASSPPPATASTAASSSSSSSSAGTLVHYATFESPSRNIGCYIADGMARCDIRTRTWSPPPTPSSCPPEVDYGQGLLVTTSGPGNLVCAGDTAMDPAAPTLAYGTATVVGSFECGSRTIGMTCTNLRSGHGFFISIQSYRTF